MDARITCHACGTEFDSMAEALRHVEQEHPEVP